MRIARLILKIIAFVFVGAIIAYVIFENAAPHLAITILFLVTSVCIFALLRYQNDLHNKELNFSAAVSHELRTPLAGIRLQAEVAMATDDPEQRKNAYENIIAATDNGTRLIEDLLMLSRVCHGSIDKKMNDIDLVALGARLVGDNAQLSEEHGVELALENADNEKVYVSGIEQGIALLVDNLLRNAVAHTPKGGRVVLSVAKEGGRALLRVSDAGPGIPEELRQAVLEPFYKGKHSGGCGLGLSIVKGITKMHGGRINLTEGVDGKGLAVSVFFPLVAF